jgi:hypothetical protein
MKVNNNMTTSSSNQNAPVEPDDKTVSRPNESGSVVISAFVRISDPENKEVFLETRG